MFDFLPIIMYFHIWKNAIGFSIYGNFQGLTTTKVPLGHYKGRKTAKQLYF